MLLNALLAWLGMMLLAILNGGLRERLYKPRLGYLAAHQLSTFLLLLLFTVYFLILAAVWPLTSATEAWTIGTIWLILTLAFEFGFGRFVAGHSWHHLLADYNLLAGRVWLLIPLWVLIAPALFLVRR
jgi:hypothetical protein